MRMCVSQVYVCERGPRNVYFQLLSSFIIKFSFPFDALRQCREVMWECVNECTYLRSYATLRNESHQNELIEVQKSINILFCSANTKNAVCFLHNKKVHNI